MVFFCDAAVVVSWTKRRKQSNKEAKVESFFCYVINFVETEIVLFLVQAGLRIWFMLLLLKLCLSVCLYVLISS